MEREEKRRRVKIFFISAGIVIFLGLIALAIYMTFFSFKECENFSCFQESMKTCRRAGYINDEPEASWGYKIIGGGQQDCSVVIKLVEAKIGGLEIDKLRGLEMECRYRRGFEGYPDKEIENCHGRLKEELQGIVIKKLHTYLIENLGKVDEGLNSAV